MPSSKPNRGTAGFTLLEMLIAVSLLGLIFAALAGGLRFGSQAWRAGAAVTAENQDWRLSHRVFRRQITAALTIEDDGDDGTSAAFSGNANSLTFTAPAPAQGLPVGLYRIKIGLKKDGDGAAATLDWSDIKGGQTGSEPLIRGLRDLKISYFGNSAATGVPQWRNEWSEGGEIPRAIMLEFQFMDRSRKHWPPMIIALPTGIE